MSISKPWLILPVLLAGCAPEKSVGPVRVSVIGGAPVMVDPNRQAPDPTQRVLLGAVAEGIVTYDAGGQVSPALAQRWIVTSDGLSAIFRMRRATWPDDRPITSVDAARRARALLAPGSRNPLRTAFDSIDEINPTTPEVIEFRLKTPRPPLLELLAQPEAVLLDRKLGSAGPFVLQSRNGDTAQLVPRGADPASAPAYPVALTGERAARAVARFESGGSDLVLGGTYRDWPILQAANPAPRTVRVDPAEGLFGLSIVRAEGFLAEAPNRQALAMAIDRDALLAAFGAPRWAGVLTVLPRPYRSAVPPTLPSWSAVDLAARIAEARRRVAAAGPERPRVRVHLPDGPGTTLLFGRIAADWLRIGVDAVRSDADEADVVLVDRVAPAGSAIWYLAQVACPAREACDEAARNALAAAREAGTLGERGARLAEADRSVAESGWWIPIAQPLRWSLVSTRLTGYRDNARAWHPLERLFAARR